MDHPNGHQPWSFLALSPPQRAAFLAQAEELSRGPSPSGAGGGRWGPLTPVQRYAYALRQARLRRERLLASAQAVAAAAWENWRATA